MLASDELSSMEFALSKPDLEKAYLNPPNSNQSGPSATSLSLARGNRTRVDRSRPSYPINLPP